VSVCLNCGQGLRKKFIPAKVTDDLVALQEGDKEEGLDGAPHGISEKTRRKLQKFEREGMHVRKDADQRKVMEEDFDRVTLLAIDELISRRDLAKLEGVINSGKESRVYLAKSIGGGPLAVKVYLTSTSEFRKRLPYVSGDRRFAHIPSNSRALVYLWARKEFKNLNLARTAGIRVPRPLACLRNIIVMEYIGDLNGRSPTFAESEVDEQDYDWTFETIARLSKGARLIHADLSEYNIFKSNSERVLFDMGSAVDSAHPKAIEFLKRDVYNMVRFFSKRGIFKRDANSWMKDLI